MSRLSLRKPVGFGGRCSSAQAALVLNADSALRVLNDVDLSPRGVVVDDLRGLAPEFLLRFLRDRPATTLSSQAARQLLLRGPAALGTRRRAGLPGVRLAVLLLGAVVCAVALAR